MRAVVLVGGEGTRLRPLTLSMPKQMLPVVEWRMIERVVAHLAAHGVDEAVLSLGYRPHAFQSAFPDGRVAGVRVIYAVEDEPLGTAGGIRYAAERAGVDDTFVAVNGDVLTDLDVGKLIGFHRERGAAATIHLTAVDDPSAFGVVPTDESGRVERFVEKPAPGRAPTNLINAGTYVLEPSVLGAIPEGRSVSIERETFPFLVEGEELFALASEDYWIDTGTPRQYLQAHRDLLAGRRPGPPAPGAQGAGAGVWTMGRAELRGEVSGPSLIGEGAAVQPGSRVAGSVVGRGSVVGPGAWVVGSVLLPEAEVGPGSVIEGSIVGSGSCLGEEAQVRCSVLGDGCELEAGACVEDARVPDTDGRGSPELGPLP